MLQSRYWTMNNRRRNLVFGLATVACIAAVVVFWQLHLLNFETTGTVKAGHSLAKPHVPAPPTVSVNETASGEITPEALAVAKQFYVAVQRYDFSEKPEVFARNLSKLATPELAKKLVAVPVKQSPVHEVDTPYGVMYSGARFDARKVIILGNISSLHDGCTVLAATPDDKQLGAPSQYCEKWISSLTLTMISSLSGWRVSALIAEGEGG